jgi:hypothetical protein
MAFPELFRRLSLLLREESIGWPPWPGRLEMAEDEPTCEDDRKLEGCFGLLERTVGLNVTVRCGFTGGFRPEGCGFDEVGSSGAVSEVEAMLAEVDVRLVGGGRGSVGYKDNMLRYERVRRSVEVAL